MPSKVHASKKSIVTMPYTPSLIQTILSVPELHRFLRLNAARGLYRRWGLAPRPEDKYAVVFDTYDTPCAAGMQLFSAKCVCILNFNKYLSNYDKK